MDEPSDLRARSIFEWLKRFDEPWSPVFLYADHGQFTRESRRSIKLLQHYSITLPHINSPSSSSKNHSSVKLEEQATFQVSRLTVCDALPLDTQNNNTVFDDGGHFSHTAGHQPTKSPRGPLNPGKRQAVGLLNVENKRSKADDDTPSFLKGPRWACPMAKHSPERYEEVYNSCTDRKGLGPELKRVPHSEHLKLVHSSHMGHFKCRKRFYKKEELNAHLVANNCGERRESIYEPEWLSTEQERVLKKGFDKGTSDEHKWRGYYKILFPKDPRGDSMNPYYDYLTPTHRTSINSRVHPASDINSMSQIKQLSMESSRTSMSDDKTLTPTQSEFNITSKELEEILEPTSINYIKSDITDSDIPSHVFEETYWFDQWSL